VATPRRQHVKERRPAWPLKFEAALRTNVASLRVKTSCQKLLLLALLAMLKHHQKEAIRERLDIMERSEVLPSRLLNQSEVERETAL
jgi:hypothetical protein